MGHLGNPFFNVIKKFKFLEHNNCKKNNFFLKNERFYFLELKKNTSF